MHRTLMIVSAVVFTLWIVLLIVFMQNTNMVLVLVVFALLYTFNAVFYIMYFKTKNQTLKQYSSTLDEKEKLLERKEQIEQKLIKEIPTGIVIINELFDIVWANEKAKEIFQNNLLSRNLSLIHKPLKEFLTSNERPKQVVMKIYENHYDIIFDDRLNTLYFYQVSEREEVKRFNYEYTDVVGVIHLDNLEDSVSVLDVQEKSEAQGQFLGALDQWAEEFGFYLAPISISKSIVFMHRKDLLAVIDKQFQVIERISEISKEYELMVTMSGGFACANIPLNQLGELAESALDLALSRGGDQVVINVTGEPLKYFGGNSNTQEKRTRISSRLNAQKLAMLFEEAENVYIVPHTFPDTDALGACIGVLKMALAMKKKAYIVLNFNELDKTVRKILQLMEYEYVGLLEYFISVDEALNEAHREDLLVLIDHHSFGQALDEKLFNKLPHRVIIDHHRKLSDFIPDARLSYIEPYASSSTELIVEMINVFGYETTVNPFEATVMLSGIIVDTNNFMYRTGARTFEAAAILRKYGADTFKVKTILRESLKDIQVKSQLLTLAEVVKKRFSIVIVPDHIDISRTLLAQVADDLLDIDNIVAAFAIGKLTSSSIGISARSLEGFNVQVVMEKFGGGGHLNNAGAQIETTDVNSVKKDLVDYLENAIQEEKPMKVILKKDVKNKGKKGEVIEVAPGYGNYLLTSKQAIEATPENMQIIEDEKNQLKAQEKAELEAMNELKQRIDYRAVKLPVKIGEKGKFYGKVSTKQIADALKQQHNIEIDKRKIQLDQTIDALGTYKVHVKLHKDVIATFELLIVEA